MLGETKQPSVAQLLEIPTLSIPFLTVQDCT
jgi:hypothetical protein